ncbi:lysine-specific demethylase JMJ25 [Punica granatum]|uniref:Lysine-specific demethylase JMJ25 n=2 Tax=Punica granatum TaxID=22663 RepID=A0A6P8E3K9_PUNGR|nr:lysine-specific demethylase JMJ25 [Punica granatum]XP_031404528.1 lysine-specific demethylase JMJ25 [Punica granatum]PKI51517.1 hypothetical protein CRG98_028077 [Punica granatum]
MDSLRSGAGNGEDNLGIPDDLRCKRSDGKQWRCTAMSMPDKTVCEKHYIQAKKRAANSALRASIKKAKRKSLGESDIYLESKMEMDDFDTPLISMKGRDSSLPASKKKKNKKSQFQHSPETTPTRFSPNFMRAGDDSEGDTENSEEDWRQRTAPLATGGSSKNRSQRSFDASPMTEESDGSTESSEDAGGITCHQCQSRYGDRIIWCLKCDRRGYCDSCISQCYSDIPLEDFQKACPACRGACNCKVCLRADLLIKTRIREIPVLDKLQYLYSLLSSVRSVIQQIHNEQCSEVELEKRLLGGEINLARAKLNEDEQMCCNICRTPIIDYHRRCANCMYDLCLHCCQDLREASKEGAAETPVGNENGANQSAEHESDPLKGFNLRINFMERFPDWKAGIDGTIPCPPKIYGGCGCPSLNLSRIFKMNWVAKLVKNVEEMVNGCKVNDAPEKLCVEMNHPNPEQYSYRGDSENTLYYPKAEDLKTGGIGMFLKHLSEGEPVIVKEVWDSSCILSWDPVVIWRGIQETLEERKQGDHRKVKAIDCLINSEIDIEPEQFIRGYSEGRIRANGLPELLKLEDWPPPSACEEFLLYQRTEFITKFPLLEYIHSKWGVLNVAAKLPHYSLQNDVGPKIFISYGTKDELGRGDSVTNLHYKMRDMVYLLAHTCDVKHEHQCKSNEEKTQNTDGHSDGGELLGNAILRSCEGTSSGFRLNGHDAREDDSGYLAANESETINHKENESTIITEEKNFDEENPESTTLGVLWDVFRRQDVTKLIEYLQMYWEEFGKSGSLNVPVAYPLFDEAIYLSSHHKRKLKEEFGIEPWSFEQHVGEAVFIPAGCPFQMRNVQSTVQVALDFLSPESLGEAVRLGQQIRCLPNDHEAKVQTLEVGKISLYAASSAIKEVQKLVLDPKYSTEIGFEDPNLTAMVSENLERVTKRKQIMCS